MTDLLLIDDDNHLTELLSHYLSERGYHVSVAHDGADGLRLVHATQPALVTSSVFTVSMIWSYFLRTSTRKCLSSGL